MNFRIPKPFVFLAPLAAAVVALNGCGGHFSGPSGPQGITLASSSSLLDPGQSATITASVTDFSGRSLPNATVTWDAPDPALVTLTPTGAMAQVVAGDQGGTVTVTARSGDQSAQIQITVKGATISFAKDIQPIFTQTCALPFCHGGPADEAGEGMVLEAGVSYGNIVNVPAVEVEDGSVMRIAPGKPDQSYLLAKLKGTYFDLGGFGSQMPLTGSLSEADLDKITKWVENGAPNN
jgi:hypothetical protein